MTDKEIDKRIEKLKKSIAADKADNSWHFIGAPPYIIGADFLDELFKRLEGAKSESAALREKLEAANKRADAAVKDMKICAEDIYCSVCKMKCSGVTCKGFEWRGEQGTEGER